RVRAGPAPDSEGGHVGGVVLDEAGSQVPDAIVAPNLWDRVERHTPSDAVPRVVHDQIPRPGGAPRSDAGRSGCGDTLGAVAGAADDGSDIPPTLPQYGARADGQYLDNVVAATEVDVDEVPHGRAGPLHDVRIAGIRVVPASQPRTEP